MLKVRLAVCVGVRTSTVLTLLYVSLTSNHHVLALQQGVIGELRVVGDPRAAERLCEEDEDDSDMVNDF